MTLIAEGIETIEEYSCLRDFDVNLMQGFLFARPAFEALPPVWFPRLCPRHQAEATEAAPQEPPVLIKPSSTHSMIKAARRA